MQAWWYIVKGLVIMVIADGWVPLPYHWVVGNHDDDVTAYQEYL